MKRTLITLCMLTLLAGSAVAQSPGNLYFNSCCWDFFGYCNFNEILYWLENAPFEASEGNHHLSFQENRSDTPVDWEAHFKDQISGKSKVWWQNHANTWGWVLNFYLTETARNTELLRLRDVYNDPNGEKFIAVVNPYPGIGITNCGIAEYFGCEVGTNQGWTTQGCKTCFQRTSLGVFEDTSDGNSLFCYPNTVLNDQLCEDLHRMVDIMTCQEWNADDGYIAPDHGTAFTEVNADGSPGLFFGQRNLRISTGEDCRDWDCEFEGLMAYNGELDWWASKVYYSSFDVMGKTYGGEWMRIGRKDYYEDPGEKDKIVHFHYPEPGDQVFFDASLFEEFAIVEHDYLLFKTASQAFGWTVPEDQQPCEDRVSAKPSLTVNGNPTFLKLNAVIENGQLVSHEWVEVDVMGGDRSEGEHASHIVVMGNPTDEAAVMATYMQSALTVNDDNGWLYTVTAWLCDAEFEAQEAIYDLVTEDNLYWNANWWDSGHEFPDFPFYRLVGHPTTHYDEDLGEYVWHENGLFYYWEEDVTGECGGFSCRSWTMVSDYNNDGRPDQGGTCVPSIDYWQTVNMCDGADDFNNHRFVNDGAAYFWGDVPTYYYGIGAPQFSAEFQDLRSMFGAAGHDCTAWRKESDFYVNGEIDWDLVYQTGVDDVNAGVRHIVAAGYNTDQHDYTRWLQLYEQMTTKQRVVLFAPSCQVGANLWWSSDFPIRHMMGDNREGTQFVRVDGLMHDGYGPANLAYKNAYRDALDWAQPGDLYDEVQFKVIRDVYEEFPKYAMGIAGFGATVKVLDAFEAVGVDEQLDPTRMMLSLPRATSSRTTTFMYEVPRDGIYKLNIYSVQGRLVAELVNGFQSQGHHQASWDHSDFASTVYLAKLTDGVQQKTQKVLVVH